MKRIASEARVLYQRFPSGGAFEYIDDGFIAGYQQLGCAVQAWTDIFGQPTMPEVVDAFRPTHIVACLHNPDRSLCRWTDHVSIESLKTSKAHFSVRMNPPDVGQYLNDCGIHFDEFPEFGVSSYYNRPSGLTRNEQRVLTSGIVDLVRTPLAAKAIPCCFRSVLDLGIPVLEEPHGADILRYPAINSSSELKYSATYIGRCWPFKLVQMAPSISALKDRFGDRFAVFGSGWPEGISRGPVDDAEYARIVASSAVSLSFHEPTQVLDRPFGQNERVFKLLSLGACVVSDANPVLATQFEIGQELLLAATPVEMVACVEMIEGDRERGREIAAGGRSRVRAEHTYAHRTERLLDVASDPPMAGSILSRLRETQMCENSAFMADIARSNDSSASTSNVSVPSQAASGVTHQ